MAGPKNQPVRSHVSSFISRLLLRSNVHSSFFSKNKIYSKINKMWSMGVFIGKGYPSRIPQTGRLKEKSFYSQVGRRGLEGRRCPLTLCRRGLPPGCACRKRERRRKVSSSCHKDPGTPDWGRIPMTSVNPRHLPENIPAKCIPPGGQGFSTYVFSGGTIRPVTMGLWKGESLKLRCTWARGEQTIHWKPMSNLLSTKDICSHVAELQLAF